MGRSRTGHRPCAASLNWSLRLSACWPSPCGDQLRPLIAQLRDPRALALLRQLRARARQRRRVSWSLLQFFCPEISVLTTSREPLDVARRGGLAGARRCPRSDALSPVRRARRDNLVVVHPLLGRRGRRSATHLCRGWTASRLLWNSPPPSYARSPRSRSRLVSTTGSACFRSTPACGRSAADTGLVDPLELRPARSRRTVRCSAGSPCSPARSHSLPPRAVLPSPPTCEYWTCSRRSCTNRSLSPSYARYRLL